MYLISNIQNLGKIVVCGDININFLIDNHNKSKLLDLTNSFYLDPTFHEATRIGVNNSTAIDYIFTNFNDTILSKKIIQNGISDHGAQLITFPIMNNNSEKSYKSRSFSQKNTQTFIKYLEDEDWCNLYNVNGDVNVKFDCFIKTLEFYYDQSFKYVIKNHMNNVDKKSWITIGIRTSSIRLKELFNMQKLGLVDSNYYKKYKTTYRRVIRLAKKMHYNKKIILSENKSKTVWNVINSTLKNKKVENNKTIMVNDTEITNKTQIANKYNNYFVNLPNDILNNNSFRTTKQETNLPNFTEKTIFLYEVNESEIINIVRELKNTNSFGADNFSTSIIKKCIQYLAKPLCYIANLCITEGKFPNALKISKVIPLFKNGDPKYISNYRPISLLSVFSKILEKVLCKRIITFFEKNNIFSLNQHGFREKKSTISALIKILDTVYKELDKNNKVLALFVDLSKAFDCVNHEILLDKIERYGLRGNCKNLLSDYLSNRKQFVHYFGENSNKIHVNLGVPQGSVLGPLLFLLYCNDIDNYISIFHTSFADDTTLLSFHKDQLEMINLMNNNVKYINEYFNLNHLVMNPTKTHTLQFHPNPSNYTYSPLIKLNKNSIVQVTTFKLLGVYIDLSLNWKCHVDYVSKKCGKNCFALKRLHEITGKETSKIFYHSNFESIIRYGIIVWGNSTAANRIFILQKRAIRCMFGLKFRETCKTTFIREKILTLPCIYILDVLKFVKQNINNFNFQNEFHNYSTRHGNDLQYNLHRLELYKSNPYYIGVTLYNKLPENIKNSSTTKFSTSVKNILIENAFYSVDEYLSHAIL